MKESHDLCNNQISNVKMPFTMIVKWFWTLATSIGTRRLGQFLKHNVPAYRDTIFFFEPPVLNSPRIGNHHSPHDDNPSAAVSQNYIALTIDDGLSRGGLETSMVPKLLDLLERYDAKATFLRLHGLRCQYQGTCNNAFTGWS